MRAYNPETKTIEKLRGRKLSRRCVQKSFQFLTGRDTKDPQLKALSKAFFEKHAPELGERPWLVSKGSKHCPSRAKKGLGADWLKSFSVYEGDECLLFPFRTTACPRGLVTYNFKRMPAHRAMCLMVHKLPPDDKPMALHKCGNGHIGCVTPSHLYWGDQSNNNRDAHRHAKEGKPEVVARRLQPANWQNSKVQR